MKNVKTFEEFVNENYKVKVYDDITEWYNLDDQKHREDGPAAEWSNGNK